MNLARLDLRLGCQISEFNIIEIPIEDILMVLVDGLCSFMANPMI